MWVMVEEVECIKVQIIVGEFVIIMFDYEKIFMVYVMELEKVVLVEFKIFVVIYFQVIEVLKVVIFVESVVIYDEMISSCMGCYQMLCLGLMMWIKKLWQE